MDSEKQGTENLGALRGYSAVVHWLRRVTDYDSEENKRWRRVPLSVRTVHACLFISGTASLFAGLFFDWRFLIAGIPIMSWGAWQESKYGGAPFDMSKYE